MKKILLLALASCLLFTSCSKKARNLSESEKFSDETLLTEDAPVEETGEVISLGEETIEATSSEEEDTEEEDTEEVAEGFVPAEIPELISYPERVCLELGQETELLKTNDFTISVCPTELHPGKDSDTYICDINITDSDSNKTMLEKCELLKISEWNNFIVCYDVLDNEHPLVTADINNNGITDYLFIIDGHYNDSLIAFEKKGNDYVAFLNLAVQVSGGPESDDIAENLIFNSGKKHNEIIIDYLPYNRRTVLEFDKKSYKFVEKQESKYKMKLYNPKETIEIMQFGNHEIAVSDTRVYLKENDEYYKIFFLGDPETYGDLFRNNNIGFQGIKILDIDESSFVVHLSFNHYHNNQFYLIFHKNGELYINKTEEIQDGIPGIFCDDGEILDMQSAVKENGGVTITYNVLEHYRDSDEDKLLDTRTTYIKSENLD